MRLSPCHQAAAIEPKDSLLYFYYGGMIYIGLKRYSEAFDLLLIVRSRESTTLVCRARKANEAALRSSLP